MRRSAETSSRSCGGVERRQHERALFGRQPRVQQHRAVVVVLDVHPALGLTARGGALGLDHPMVAAHQPLQLRRGRVPREREQILLALHVLHPRERARLRVAQLTLGERRPHQRQLLQPPRHPHLFTRRPRRDPALMRDPMRARLTTPLGPAAPPVVLRDERQPPARRRMDPARQIRDLPLEQLERRLLPSYRTHVRMLGRRSDGEPVATGASERRSSIRLRTTGSATSSSRSRPAAHRIEVRQQPHAPGAACRPAPRRPRRAPTPRGRSSSTGASVSRRGRPAAPRRARERSWRPTTAAVAASATSLGQMVSRDDGTRAPARA